MPTVILIPVLIAIFVLVYACTIYALEQTEFRKSKLILAFPVGILCVLSLLRRVGNSREESLVDVVLIPYEALVYALLFLVILWILSRFHLRIQKTLKQRDRPKSESEYRVRQREVVANIEKEARNRKRLKEEDVTT